MPDPGRELRLLSDIAGARYALVNYSATGNRLIHPRCENGRSAVPWPLSDPVSPVMGGLKHGTLQPGSIED